MFHIEDQTEELQVKVYAVITKAAEIGIQITPLDIDASSQGDLFIDGMNAEEWLEIMAQG